MISCSWTIPKKIEETALHIAVENKYSKIVEILLDYHSVDVNIRTMHDNDGSIEQKTALHIAIEKNNLEIIKLLLECKMIDVNIKSYNSDSYEQKTALYVAVENENREITELLLMNDNIDPNIKSKSTVVIDKNKVKVKEPALFAAVRKENIDIINLLLKCKEINLDATNEKGKKAIETTANTKIKKLLIGHH